MNLILLAESNYQELEELFRSRGHFVHMMRWDAIVGVIRSGIDQGLKADAIVCGPSTFDETFDQNQAEALGREITKLPNYCAMEDGRKWSAIPFIILNPYELRVLDSNVRARLGHSSIDIGYDENAIDDVQKAVTQYRRKLLDELDNLGFIVSYRNGRFQVGPALKPRATLDGDLYYGAADKRNLALNHYWTVDRDVYGIQYEIEKFEALINQVDVSEKQIHAFFEEHPHFLAAARGGEPISHPEFKRSSGKVIIPDFVLRPIVAVERGSNWEILDLKKPNAKLLAGVAERARFSQEVMKSITQLRDYGDYFNNPSNTNRVEAVLGRSIRYPRLAVLIGRLPQSDMEEFEKAQAREPDVRIVTYDEVLETQKRLL